MSGILKWSSLAAVGVLTAVAMMSGSVRPAAADGCGQGGQGSDGGSCQQSTRYSQQYGVSYDSRANGGRYGRWTDGRRNERGGFDNGYGDNARRRSSGYGARRDQGRGWQSQRGQAHRWDGRDYGQGGPYRQSGRNDQNDRDHDRGYGNDQDPNRR